MFSLKFLKSASGRMVLAVLFGALLASYAFTQSTPRYSAEIRRTSHGIPHITARDVGSLGFGEGYAFAQDHICSLADQVVRARGDRARYFGAGEGDRHLNSDLTMRALELYDQARTMYKTMPKELRETIDGYVAGYNQYLSEVGVNKVGGWCRGQEWLLPISAIDLLAYNQSVVITSTNFADMSGRPPRQRTGWHWPPRQRSPNSTGPAMAGPSAASGPPTNAECSSPTLTIRGSAPTVSGRNTL